MYAPQLFGFKRKALYYVTNPRNELRRNSFLGTAIPKSRGGAPRRLCFSGYSLPSERLAVRREAPHR